MDAELIIIIFGIVLFLIGFCCMFSMVWKKTANTPINKSNEQNVFKNPTGEPFWHGVLPDIVDDYVEPRYVYENLVESTEFLPENGRIIGYRISPTLVIHSTMMYDINPPILGKYVQRLGGHLLNETEVSLLKENWNKISELCIKSGDEPLGKGCLWFDVLGKPYAMDFESNRYRDNFCNWDFYAILVLKR